MTAMRKVWLFLLVIISAVLLPLALPNEIAGGAIGLLGIQPAESFYWGNAVLGLVCLVPAFIAVALSPSFGFASLLGVVFGGVSTALSNFWLMFFQGYSVWTYGGVIVGYAGLNALLFPFLRGFSRINRTYRPFLLAAAWAVYEYFKSVGFLGYPWGLIAYPVGEVLPLVQFVDITGVWGLSFLMALINSLLAELALSGWKPRFVRQMTFGVVLVACALVYGTIRLATPIPSEGTASLLLVQQNKDPWEEGKGQDDSILINSALTRAGVLSTSRPPDLAVWSESSVSTIGVFLDGQYYPKNNQLVPAVQSAGVPVLFGGVGIVDMKRQMYWNAAVLASADGAVQDIYGKIHRVPFAENIPFYEVPWVRRFFRSVIGIELPWADANRYTIFSVPLSSGGNLRFGVPICFEDAFSDLCRTFINRGADLLINITNDSWSKTWSAEIQHFTVARFRAIENRRVLVRSTNGGVSAVVGPWGEIRDRLPLFERTRMSVDVPLYKERTSTPYTRFGDWFAWLMIAALFIVLVVDLLPKKKRLSVWPDSLP
jgi:apolipoprotein N-acyltransferase